MSSPHKSPASFRYAKARLRVLARPSVWASTIGLCLLLAGVWQSWTHPEWLNATGNNSGTQNNQAADSTDTTEERSLSADDIAAIGADIDSSPVLAAEIGSGNVPPLEAPLIPKPSTKPESLLELLTRQQSPAKTASTNPVLTGTSTEKLAPSNPFLPSTLELPTSEGSLLGIRPVRRESPSLASGIPSSSGLDFNGVNPLTTNQNVARTSVSPLQEALNQVTRSNTAPTSTATETPTKASNQSASTAKTQGQTVAPTAVPAGTNNYNLSSTTRSNPLSNAYPANSYTYLNQPQSASSVPGTTPPNSTASPYSNNSYTYLTQPQLVPTTPTTPTTAPVTSSPFNSPAIQSANQSNGFNNSGLTSNSANSGLQPSQLNQPNFTAPRPVPGRYIGGGQINTFSNP